MSKISKIFNNKINLADKFLITTILLIPLSLAISIFTADFLTSVSSLIFIFIFLRKDLGIFKKIKKEIIFFFIFYLIILISLFLTKYKSESFLASFFYFRYFLLSLIIFYLLKKYNFFFKIFYKVILLSIGLVVLDSSIQYIFGTNLLGYGLVTNREGDMIYLSGFFNEEKKLGSYLVRFLPLILSVIYFNEKKISLKIELIRSYSLFFISFSHIVSHFHIAFIRFVIYDISFFQW